MKYHIPTNITREHIIQAINEVSKNGYDRKRDSRKYDLLHEGKRYPPKVVLTIANKFANGEELHHSKFSGGVVYANKFLKDVALKR
jgi:5-methylcytosine-specific restriction protein B